MDHFHPEDSRPSGSLSAVDQAQLRLIVEQARARLRDGDPHSALQVSTHIVSDGEQTNNANMNSQASVYT
jgi:hypothetical protein